MRKHLARIIPESIKPLLRKIYYFPVYLAHRVKFSAHGTDMVPPASMVFVGIGDFERVGKEFRRYFIELGALKSCERILDVGCGIGRMAIPLTEYLSSEGRYEGFDIVREGIEWCTGRITPRFGNFRFQHSDVFNKHYNPGGKIAAADYRFPFDDASFDFAFLTSVFTHMFPRDLENYLSELARVLKPGGRCLITLFLLNEESRTAISAGRSELDFRHEVPGGCLTSSPKDPEAAIAYDERTMFDLFERFGLKVGQPVHYGSWCGREEHLSFQDIVVATKVVRGGGTD